MSAAGRVATGFSEPWVAKYAASSGTVTYSDGQKLARGVSVSIEPETSDDNKFYADNIAAEVAAGIFTGGTATLTVDGLLTASKAVIMGTPAADTAGWTAYGDNQEIPYVGLGFIVRYQSDGEVTYVPTVLAKVAFEQEALSAATQEEEIDWQTQELTANILKDDTTNHNWKFEGAAQTTEALALAALKTKLGVTP